MRTVVINVMYLLGCYTTVIRKKARHRKEKAGAACLYLGNNKPFIRNIFKNVIWNL